MIRAYKFEMKPTAAQAAKMADWCGAARFVYNAALEQRRDFWRHHQRDVGRGISWFDQSRELTVARRETDWLAAVCRNALDFALQDLDRAFAKFFAGGGYPKFRARGDADGFRLKAEDVSVRRLNAKWSAVRLSKVGWVKFRDTRPVKGDLRGAAVTLRAGRWSVAFIARSADVVQPSNDSTVGIDRGIARTLTLSTGEFMQAPNTTAITGRRKRAQRAVERRRKGSARRRAAKARVAALSGRAARIRTDWSHRASTDIARRFGLVAVEALKIKNMTASAAGTVAEPGRGVRQKAGLNRSILEQCWGRFAQFLDYKLEERGGVLISVPAAYTSQTCACCGVVDARSRKSQAVFACVHCGHTDNADVNAAREILRRSTALLGVEGSHWRPTEASIMATA